SRALRMQQGGNTVRFGQQLGIAHGLVDVVIGDGVRAFGGVSFQKQGEVHDAVILKQETDQTVAMGVTGEPTAPGRRKGGAVSRKRLRWLASSHNARSRRYQSSAKGSPSLNRQW